MKQAKNLFFALLLFLGNMIIYAQCSVNAGGNATICGTSYTLQGSSTGTTVGNPTWMLVSKPSGAPDPVISNINSYTPNVTGMTSPGNYVFQISQVCTSTGTTTSQVTITAPGDVSTFTAGPDITNVNATTGTVNLNGVVPAGYTAQWSAYNIYKFQRGFGKTNTNATFGSTTSGSTTFTLTKKADHNEDPAYVVTLRITSTNNPNCWYEDTAIVRFIPNPQIVVPNRSVCLAANESSSFIYLSNTSPIFGTDMPGGAGNPSYGTSVTMNVNSQPAGGNIQYAKIMDGILFFTGVGVMGTYKFTLTVTNSSGTYTTPEITFTNNGIAPTYGTFIVASDPEQMEYYSFTATGGEVQCGMAGSTVPITFRYALNPVDDPTVITTSVSTKGIMPPGGAPSVAMTGGAGATIRSFTATPPAGGWRVGTYMFHIVLSNGSCNISVDYYLHISDGSRPNVAVPNTTVCYPGSGVVTATIPLPAVYKQVVNSSYFQDLNGQYSFTVVSKPAGSGTPTAPVTSFTSTSAVIGNLTTPGEYVFKIRAYNTTAGDFIGKEYECSGTSREGTFSVFVSPQINSNAGSDQTLVGTTQAALNGNNPGASSTGTWTLVSKPSGAADPVIVTPSAYNSNITGLNTAGTYTFRWTITTGTCTSSDDVDVIIPGSCVNNAPTIFYNADNAGNPYGNTGGTGNLLPFVTVSNIAGGTYYKTTGTETLNGVRPKSSSTLFSMSGITNAVQASKYYSFNITMAANAPILHFNRFSAIAMDVDLILSPGGMPNVSYNLRVAIVDPDTGTETNLGNVFINSVSPVDLAVSYKLKPGKIYQVKLYPWNTNGRTITYLDNPRLYFTPVPSAPASVCLPSLSGTVGTALASYITNTTPAGMQVRWLQNGTDVTGNTIAAGTYTPVYYNTSGSCYADTTGDNIVVTLCSADIQVNKVGPLSAQTGSTISYNINVTNNGPNNATNIILKDPVVGNFTATGITCTAGTGTLGSAQCPASVTLAGLQGAGLTIPTLPEGSAVRFTITGTVGNVAGAIISNVASVECNIDTNIANNSSVVNTELYSCISDETTYTIDVDATLAANTIAPNGGTVNMIYKLSSGTAIPSIGNQFTLPVTYSDLNNRFGVDNQWEGLGKQVTGAGSFVVITPKTSAGTGRLYNSLPANNSTDESLMASNNQGDNIFTSKIANGELDPLGSFSISIGNYPSTPAGYVIKTHVLNAYANGNRIATSSVNQSGFWLKQLANPAIRNDGTEAVNSSAMMPGGFYMWRYSAFSNGSSFVDNYAGTTNVRGVTFWEDSSITFAKTCVAACYKPSATGTALDTKVGITSLNRAGADADNWPMARKGGWIALESKTKGFVPNRIKFNASNQPVADDGATLILTSPVEGMMVYDTTNKCMKVYTQKEGDASMAWHCLSTQTCPDGLTK